MKKLVKFALAVILALCSQALAASAELSNENQAKLIKHIDSYSSRMSEVALKIWSTPELGYQESKTSALLQDERRRGSRSRRASPVSPLRSLRAPGRATVR